MIALLLALVACGPKQEAVPAPEPAPVPKAEPAPADPSGSPLVGDWFGRDCGERTYPRELKISADGTWAARDLVSPCPQGARCVWSGIVLSNGTWTADGDGIAMTETTDDERARPRPTRLDPSEGGAQSTEADGRCTYTPGTTP